MSDENKDLEVSLLKIIELVKSEPRTQSGRSAPNVMLLSRVLYSHVFPYASVLILCFFYVCFYICFMFMSFAHFLIRVFIFFFLIRNISSYIKNINSLSFCYHFFSLWNVLILNGYFHLYL